MATPNYILEFFSANGVYPSDSDVWWLYKNADETFTPSLADKVTRGNSPAPRGYFILNAFRQDRSTESGVSGLDVVTSGGARPSTIEFFAGRMFYAGTDHPDYSSTIYFSQIIEEVSQFGLCHQRNDPTAENSNDLLASDGGTIVIPEVGKIYRLWAIEGSLLVFASNGIWAASGSSGIGFTALDYSVNRLSSVRSISAGAFVDASGFPIWWTSEGVYSIKGGGNGGSPQVVSLTDDTFKSFMQDIPDESKKYAKGAYDPLRRVVQWVYRSTAPTTTAEQYSYDSVLCLNLISSAFYTWSFDNTNVRLHGIAVVGGSASLSGSESVEDSAGSLVLDSLGATVTSSSTTITQAPYAFKYLVSTGDTTREWTFAEAYNTLLRDWVFFDDVGERYDSSFVSGYQVRGEALRDFQTNYVLVYADSEVDSSCYIQGRWDYSTSGDTGRWSTKQLLEYEADDHRYNYKRVKIRGHGKAMQVKIESYEDEPFYVIGWATWQTGDGSV